jgi:hypothetical protein
MKITRFDWDTWLKNHEHPGVAKFVYDWLVRNDPDEEVWRCKEELVDLVIEARKDQ